jgi:hypothetical protein
MSMFELRDSHMSAFERTAEGNFVERTCTHVRKTLPNQTAEFSGDALRTRVETGSERAKAYGLTWERSMVRFVETEILLGEGFDHDPRYDWSVMILRNRDFGQDQRSLALVLCAVNAAKRREANG